jgi:hypothetical protein
MPDTEAKRDVIADLLNPVEKFLKIEFLLRNMEVNSKIKDLYAKFEKFCEDNKLHCETMIEFRSGMKQYGFDFKMICGYNCYRITVDQLKAVAEKRKWLHDLDKDQNETDSDDEDDEDDEEDEAFNKGIDVGDKSVTISKLTPTQQYEYYENQQK